MADFPRDEFFHRIDEAEDEEFYQYPRPVVHIDDGAIATVCEIYAEHIRSGCEVLDLMSSWRSHLPPRMNLKRVTGVGLNRAEMEDNPALTDIVIHNVNRAPRLPLPDESYDAAVMTVSAQYLTRPIEVFSDVARVLRIGGPFIVTFSNRMFPTKAVAIWRAANDGQRVALVTRYFRESGGFERIESIDRSRPANGSADPIWAVLGYKSAESNR